MLNCSYTEYRRYWLHMSRYISNECTLWVYKCTEAKLSDLDAGANEDKSVEPMQGSDAVNQQNSFENRSAAPHRRLTTGFVFGQSSTALESLHLLYGQTACRHQFASTSSSHLRTGSRSNQNIGERLLNPNKLGKRTCIPRGACCT